MLQRKTVDRERKRERERKAMSALGRKMDHFSHKIPVYENSFEVVVHVVVVHGHEKSVNDYAQRDEEFHERVVDNGRKELLQSDPAPTAIPNTKKINRSEERCFQPLFQRRLFDFFIHFAFF